MLSANAYAFRAKQYRLQADAAYFPGGAGFAGTYFGQFASAGRGAKLVERSHAEEVIRWNAQTVAARLRVLADDILYHRLPTRFTMEKQIGALEKIARQHPDNPVGQFCYWHFSRIARVLRTQKPLYARDLLADKQRRMPLLPALKSYLSLKSPALRNAGRLSVMLSVASLMGTALHLPKSYWILMTVLLVTQNGYGATRLRIVNRSVGTVVGLIIAGVALHFKIPEVTP